MPTTRPTSGPERQTHANFGKLLVGADPTRLAERILSPAALTDIVAGLARVVHLWTHQLGHHPGQRSSLRMITTLDYDVWMIRWPTATSVTPHDHGVSAGAFAVARGALREQRWHGTSQHTRLITEGATVTIEEGTVHDVIAVGSGALSVHAYSPPLTSMGFYDETGQILLDRRPVDGRMPAAEQPRSMHPAGRHRTRSAIHTGAAGSAGSPLQLTG
jgi:hypothetical protein